MAVVLKFCETENQYMADFEDDAVADKAVKDGKAHLEDDGTIWYLREQDQSEYHTKVMKPGKKVVRKKKVVKSED